MGAAEPLRITLRPSASLAAFLFLGHGLALAVLPWLGGLPALVRGLLALVLVSSGGFYLRRARRPVAVQLWTGARGVIDVRGRDGDWREMAVQGDTVVLPWFILLRLRDGDGNLDLILPLDAMARNDHRRLRRWLLWAGTPDAKGDAAEPA